MKKMVYKICMFVLQRVAVHPNKEDVLENRLAVLNNRINALEKNEASKIKGTPWISPVADTVRPASVDPVNCEKCGCMVRIEIAIKGKPEIRRHATSELNSMVRQALQDVWNGVRPDPVRADYLYYPYYCKACAPKQKKGV